MSTSRIDDLYGLIDGIEVAMLTRRRQDGQLVSRGDDLRAAARRHQSENELRS